MLPASSFQLLASPVSRLPSPVSRLPSFTHSVLWLTLFVQPHTIRVPLISGGNELLHIKLGVW